jgi:glutathione synthase/RimK-type ligase-like ATP-grasp enzyme
LILFVLLRSVIIKVNSSPGLERESREPQTKDIAGEMIKAIEKFYQSKITLILKPT